MPIDRGAVEAARHGIARSPHWPAVERAFRESHPTCLACAVEANDEKKPERSVQVHHCHPFHYVVALGRPDLELDPRNLVALCEDEKGRPAEDHHLLIGHLGNFKEGNLNVAADASGVYHGLSKAVIRNDATWKDETRSGRLKPLDEMTAEEKRAYRSVLDRSIPPDRILIQRYGLQVT